MFSLDIFSGGLPPEGGLSRKKAEKIIQINPEVGLYMSNLVWEDSHMIMNEDNWNELDAETIRLINLVCEGVELPTEEEENEMKDIMEKEVKGSLNEPATLID